MKNRLKKIFPRQLYPFAHVFLTAYWFIVRPKTRGVKVIVEHDGKVVLVKLTYAHDKWTFPGGGVGKNESYEMAARREVKEEVGIDLTSINFIGEFRRNQDYKDDTVQCFLGRTDSTMLKIDNREILQAAWFLPSEIPAYHASTVDIILKMFEDQ